MSAGKSVVDSNIDSGSVLIELAESCGGLTLTLFFNNLEDEI